MDRFAEGDRHGNVTDTYAAARTGLDRLTKLLDNLYNKCDPAERRILNRALFTRITIHDEENATYTPEQTTPPSLPTPASTPRCTSPQKQNCPAIRRGKFRFSHLTWVLRDSNPRHPRCKRGALTN